MAIAIIICKMVDGCQLEELCSAHPVGSLFVHVAPLKKHSELFYSYT